MTGLERTWKEVVLFLFMVLSHYVPRTTEENHGGVNHDRHYLDLWCSAFCTL